MNELTVIFPDAKEVGKKNKPIRVLGIDLGTTNSTIAEIKWNFKQHSPIVVRCLEVEQDTLEGQYTHFLVPSVVTIYRDKVYIGEGAKRLRALSPEFGFVQNKNIFYECKNDMGVQRTYHMAPEGF